MRLPVAGEQRARLAGSSGAIFIQDTNQGIAQAGSNLGKAILAGQEDREERQARTAVAEAENVLRTMSRESYLDVSQNRRGKLAMADEETGYQGVYREYEVEADRFIGERLAKISPRYQDMAKARLDGVAGGWKDKFAVHEAKETASHRQEMFIQNVGAIKDDLYLTMGEYGGLDDIDAAVEEIRVLTEAEAKGGPTTEFLEAQKSEIYKQAILSKAMEHPLQAEEMLQTKQVKKVLDPSVIESLDKVVEQKKIEKQVNAEYSAISADEDLSYASRVELANDIEDPDVKKQVLQKLNADEAQYQKVKSTEQYNLIQETYDDIFANGTVYDPTTFDTDPKYDVLDSNQKITLKSWVGGGKEGQFAAGDRLKMWGEWREKIIGFAASAEDIMNAAGKTLDFRDAKELIKFREDVISNPRIKQGDDILRADYREIWEDAEDKNMALRRITEAMYDYQVANQRFPDTKAMQEIVDWAATKTGQKHFFGIPFFGKAPYQYESADLEKPRFMDKIVTDYQAAGYPDAQIDYESGIVKLFERDDYRAILRPGETEITYQRNTGE